MTTFDDRDKGFESKFAHDEELEFKAIARRDRLIAAWAAGLMGLEGERQEDYAKAVVRAELTHHGEEDVLRKIMQDLEASGTKVSEGEIRRKMDEFLAQAREALKGGA